jgi:hypothetical protein
MDYIIHYAQAGGKLLGKLSEYQLLKKGCVMELVSYKRLGACDVKNI